VSARPARWLGPWWRLVPVAAAVVGIVLLQGAGDEPEPEAQPGDPAPAIADSVPAPNGVTAYYFYTLPRCVSCRKIEAYAREAVEAAFPEELGDGRLAWRVVNVGEEGNEHFIKDYKLYTKSLVLVDRRDGEETRWKNLEKVWTLLGDKDGFLEYVRTETRSYLSRDP